MGRDVDIIGLIRIRNESLILQDTLDHLSTYVDGIVVLDDSSVDNSPEIASAHQKVLEVLKRDKWDEFNREIVETKDRQKLLEAARKYDPTWIFYADADERFEGNIREFLITERFSNIDGIRISLFDSYMTISDHLPYKQGQELYNFRKYFGPEKREVLMIWRNKPEVRFEGLNKREPMIRGRVITRFYCQHYGKSLSIEHWNETCDYYIKYFNKYSKKWMNRKGKAIHRKSDFGRPLYNWNDVKKNSILIYRYQTPNLFYKIKDKINSFLLKS